MGIFHERNHPAIGVPQFQETTIYVYKYILCSYYMCVCVISYVINYIKYVYIYVYIYTHIYVYIKYNMICNDQMSWTGDDLGMVFGFGFTTLIFIPLYHVIPVIVYIRATWLIFSWSMDARIAGALTCSWSLTKAAIATPDQPRLVPSRKRTVRYWPWP